MGGMLISDDLTHHSAVHGLVSQPTKQDPYRYQHGFGNHHATEAFAGALPRNGTNLPQRHPYGLYAEHLNGTSFISSRESVANVYVFVLFIVCPGLLVLQFTWTGVDVSDYSLGGCIESGRRWRIDLYDPVR